MMIEKCWVAMGIRCRSIGWGKSSTICKATGGFVGIGRHVHSSCCVVAWFLSRSGKLQLWHNEPAGCICSMGSQKKLQFWCESDSVKAKVSQVLPTTSVCTGISEFAKKTPWKCFELHPFVAVDVAANPGTGRKCGIIGSVQLSKGSIA